MRVVVVGTGIVGAATAYHLAMSDADLAVTVVDHGHDGKATLAGAGIVCPWSSTIDDGPFFELYAAGAQYYDELIAGLDRLGVSDIGYRRVGALVVAEEPVELDAAMVRLERRANTYREVGHFERVTASQAQRLFPPLRTGLEGIHISGGARVDGRLLAAALLDAASARGVTVVNGHAEIRMADGRAGSQADKRVVGVETGAGHLAADAVVVAGGAWTKQLLAPLGVEVDVEPQKGQIVHLELAGVDTSRWPSLLPIGAHYLVAFDHSRVVVGATRETGSGFDTRVTAAGQAEVLHAGLRYAPGLADARIIETRVGLRPLASGLPTIGEMPRIAGLYVGTGLGAAGLTIGPLVGKFLGDLVLGRPATLGW